MTGPMNPQPLTYFCSECDEESEPWEDEPLGPPQWTALDESYARAEAMGHGEHL